ncbi:MAG: HEPN domain-containing protein [Candidatus Eisenbacteria bacterium]|nr:HEPN domain-containing protein [Candidatus Eisenbacteria bacterium]
MHDPKAEGRRWLALAENDPAFARHALQGEFFYQVCFVCQPCVAKALKALRYARGARNVIGHSVVKLLDATAEVHPALESLRDSGAELDLYYIASRYPNGLVEGTPHESFTRKQDERALASGEEGLAAVRGLFRNAGALLIRCGDVVCCGREARPIRSQPRGMLHAA